MSDLFGFDEEYYLNAKLNALKGDPEHADITTTEELKVVISESGMTPQEHYKRYGNSENISTSAYFNKAEYLTAKLVALRESSETSAEWANKSIDELEVVMAQAGMTPAEHYSRYGYAETRADGTLLNPSNAFDANAYFAAKLEELQKTDPDHYGSATVLDVLGIFQQQQLDPVSHYLSYGASEAIISKTPMVQTVPTSQRMPEDPARAEMGTLVPDNPSKPSLPPSLALPFEVPQPGDMGGHNYETVLPPATEPVPTPEIPGITPPADPKPEEPKPEEPKPEEPGTGGGSGSGGGTDPGPAPGPEPEPGPEPSLPEGELITLNKANAVVTPLTSINADGRYTANNRSDFVEITTTAALNAILEGGSCNDGRWEQENDTLTISVNTNGNAAVNGGIVDLSIANFESISLGEGVQKVHPGDYDKYYTYTIRNISFDDKEDVLDLTGLTQYYVRTISTEGVGQGNIVHHDYAVGNTNYFAAGLDLSDVKWSGDSTLNSIHFSNTGDTHLTIHNADLAKVGLVKAEAHASYATLNLRGEIESVDGKGQILDANVENFGNLWMESATLADDVTTLELAAQYSSVRMNASQWEHLTQLSTIDAGNSLRLSNDYGTPSLDKIAVGKVLEVGAVQGFSTLDLRDMQGLDNLDASQSTFTRINLDYTTSNTLAAKTVVGNSSQTLCADNVYDERAFTALSGIQGFTALELNGFSFEGTRELTLKHGSALNTIRLSDGSRPSSSNGLLYINNVDETDKIVYAHTGIALKTTGIKTIDVSGTALLDVSCFDDEKLSSVTGGGYLYLNGKITQALMDSFASPSGVVSNKYALNFSVATLEDGLTTIDAAKFERVEFTNKQAAGLTVNNLKEIIIHGNDTDAADLSGLTFNTTTGSVDPVITIQGSGHGDNFDMSGYTKALMMKGARGTMIGGEGDDHFNASGYGTMKGGAGEDTIYIHVDADETGSVFLDGGDGIDDMHIQIKDWYKIRHNFETFTMTGGSDADTFKLSLNMDNLQTSGDNIKNYPDIRLEITDFDLSVKETLDISSIRYDGLPDSDGLATTRYFESGDYVGKADTKGATEFNVALQNAAKAITADKIGVFKFGSDTYLFGNNIHVAVDRGDLLIKLTGVDADQLTTANFVFQA